MDEAKSLAESLIGRAGRIFGSKGQYSWDHKNHVVLFNSNICTKSHGKIWHGDFDITVDEEKLANLAKALKERVYVLYESDARFNNEKNPKFEHAVFSIDESGNDVWCADYYHRSDNQRLYHKDPEPPTAEEEEEKKLRYLASEICKQEKYKETNVKIPWSKINRLNANKSPMHKFWAEVESLFDYAKEAEDTKQEFFRSIMLSAEDEKKLKQSFKSWVEKYHDYLSEYRKEQEVSWCMFLSGPSTLQYTPDWMKPGFFYIKNKEEEV